MDGIILYQSKYGASEIYARWLSEQTGFTCIETKNARISAVLEYDIIILGGGIYASGISGLSFLKNNIDYLKEKKISVFCVGASPYEEEAYNEIVKHNMKDELSNIPCYYCRGIWDIKAMNLIDRSLCTMLKKMVAKKDPKDCKAWERALMQTNDDRSDWTDQKYLKPILDELKR